MQLLAYKADFSKEFVCVPNKVVCALSATSMMPHILLKNKLKICIYFKDV
jgi:hypothetical protein